MNSAIIVTACPQTKDEWTRNVPWPHNT